MCSQSEKLSTCVPKVRNYGDFRQCVIPDIITCMLQGTRCDTGIPNTFYGENICSVGTKMANKFNNFEKFDRKKSNSPIFLSSDLLITSQVP